MDVIIIGAGGHAAEVDEYIRYSRKVTGQRRLNIIGFLDDNAANYARYKFSAPLLGGIQEHKVLKNKHYLLGIANLEFRRHFAEKFKKEGAEFISFIHCSAYVSESAEIGEGSIIAPNANIGPNVKIGKYTLVNSRCSLGHDTVIGDFNFICPNVCMSGFTKVGDENLFGINSATVPGVKIGNRNKIAAGMIIDLDVENETTVFYRYKEKILAVPRSY